MEEKKKGFFSRLVEGLTKTRENIVSGMDSIFSGFSAIDDDFYEELEETLIMGDMGIQTTMAVIEDLKKNVKEQHIKDPEQCREALIASIRSNSHTRRHSPLTIMNTVMHGTVSSMRQPKISRPLNGVSNDVK